MIDTGIPGNIFPLMLAMLALVWVVGMVLIGVFEAVMAPIRLIRKCVRNRGNR